MAGVCKERHSSGPSKPMSFWATTVLAATWITLGIPPSQQANYMSHTTDAIFQRSSRELCPDSPADLQWIGDFNLTHYKRQPLAEHLKHRRALDQSGEAEVHPEVRLELGLKLASSCSRQQCQHLKQLIGKLRLSLESRCMACMDTHYYCHPSAFRLQSAI